MITDGPEGLIKKLDDMIREKQRREMDQITRKVTLSLKLKNHGIKFNSPAFDYSEYIDAVEGLTIKGRNIDWQLAGQIASVVAKIYQKRRQDQLKRQRELGMNLTTASLKGQPPLVVEVI